MTFDDHPASACLTKSKQWVYRCPQPSFIQSLDLFMHKFGSWLGEERINTASQIFWALGARHRPLLGHVMEHGFATGLEPRIESAH